MIQTLVPEQRVLVSIGSDCYEGVVLKVSKAGGKAWVCYSSDVTALRTTYKLGDECNAEVFTRRDDGTYRKQGFKRGMAISEWREGRAGLDPSF